MAADIAPLPREPDTLIGMIADFRYENGKLRAMLETLRRALYGARSERFDAGAGQLALGLEDVASAPVEHEQQATPRTPDGRARPKTVRNIGGLPKHLPREDVVIEPGIDACPCCRGKLHRIGEDVSEMLDIVPAILRVRRIHRPRYSCRACGSAVIQAPAPPRPVDGGLPTTALLAHVAAGKFAWHLPLHRQTQMLAAYGVHLDRSTLVHWIGRTAWWLQPLYALLTQTVLQPARCFATTRHCRCWIAHDDAHGPRAYGATLWTTGHGRGRSRQRRSTVMPRIAAAGTCMNISAGSAACCRSMATPDLTA